jgi:hypothetical protein
MPDLTVLIYIPFTHSPVYDFEHLVSQRTSAPLADAELLILRKTLKYSLKCSGADQRQRLTRTYFYRFFSHLFSRLFSGLNFGSKRFGLFYSLLSNVIHSFEGTSSNIGLSTYMLLMLLL